MRHPLTLRHGRSGRRGATLLVTLGILTVLSVLVVAFLVASRLHRQVSVADQNRLAARNYMDAGLHLAMRQIEDAFTYPNYTDQDIGQDELLAHPRVAPVGQWFSDRYDKAYKLSRDVAYKARDVLASPTVDGSPYVNLATPQVLRLIPSALTNGLQLSANHPPFFRSGWIPLDLIPTNAPVEMRLHSKPARIAYTVFNCSGFLDANTFLGGPTQRKLPRQCFSQSDVTNWEASAEVQARLSNPNVSSDPGNTPFFHLSYDPDPHAMPLAKDSVQPPPVFGTRAYVPPAKFDINTITNHFLALDSLGIKKRLAVMPSSWFNNVTSLLQSASISNLDAPASYGGRDAYFGDPQKTAWNIVNYMTESRIPTAFPENVLESNKASRLDYAIEAVPLINEVRLKDIFGTSKTENSYADADSRYQEELIKIEQQIRSLFTTPENGTAPTVNIEWSNIYAFDVELWYPFKTNAVPENTYLWLSVTTNSPSLFSSAQSPYAWLEDHYNTLGSVLFSRWNMLYTSTNTNTIITNDIVWTAISTNAVLLNHVKNPIAFDSATNQADIAEGVSELWTVTFLSGITSFSNSPSYTQIFLDTTLMYTNRLTQAVLSGQTGHVTAVLKTPFSGLVDWGDATAWARYFQALFKTSANQYSEYEKIDVSQAYGVPGSEGYGNEYQVFYSTNLVYQPYIETNQNTGVGANTITVRFKPLAGEPSAKQDSNFFTWLRSMVTVSEIDLSVLDNANGIPEPVDEALLIRNGSNDNDIGFYRRWDKPCSISIDDPRDNAYNDRWREYDDKDTMGSQNANCNVAEYPFIHYDRPFQSIGELGHINVDLTNRFTDLFQKLPHPSSKDKPRDTIDFSTRSGASLLDKFCVGGVSNVTRGLVQANTTHGEVIRRVLNQIATGWPTGPDGQTSGDTFQLNDAHTQTWVDHWTNTLLRTYANDNSGENSGLAGWASFADMFPDLATNAMIQSVSPLPVQVSSGLGVYDYTEDVLRGIVDKLSFRQNVFVIVVAAQALSPASTDTHPVVLAEQRAAVTVIRDAYTGKWLIHDWVWLTE